MNEVEEIIELLPDSLRLCLNRADASCLAGINEIRIHRGLPVSLVISGKSLFLRENGELSRSTDGRHYIMPPDEFDKMLLAFCDYSVYSNSDNLCQGYITLKNGARVGIASTAVYESDTLISVKCITSVNIRIPRQAEGCSLEVLRMLFSDGLHSVIVAGAPSSGKTTLLRDMALNLSNGFDNAYRRVAMIDERNELAGKRENEYSLRTGVCCDVLTSFEKAKGIELATRTLSPEIIVCDEISRADEARAVRYGLSCGVRFLLSVHIGSRQDLYYKPIIRELISGNEFEYIVLLDGHTYRADIIEVKEVKNEIVRRFADDAFHNISRNMLF